ncbi:hypothetical protein BDD12DRAFT_459744 [Trichophaea hybrida]|nr:hypothetical protein BDD12DRAFT_459744 [Trichophaea hybrida]
MNSLTLSPAMKSLTLSPAIDASTDLSSLTPTSATHSLTMSPAIDASTDSDMTTQTPMFDSSPATDSNYLSSTTTTRPATDPSSDLLTLSGTGNWRRIGISPTAPSNESVFASRYPTGTSTCWQSVPTGIFWPHPSGARVPCGHRVFNTSHVLIPTIPAISNGSPHRTIALGLVCGWVKLLGLYFVGLYL